MGVEAAISEQQRRLQQPRPPRNRFAINLALIVVVGLLATFWFQRHLQPWFTEVSLIGGGITLWALLRLALELLSKAGGVDPWAITRRHLASLEWTVLLLAALLLLIGLWLFTSSVYLRFDARSAKENSYQVSVGTADARASLIAVSTLSAAQTVVGRPLFGWGAVGPLQCHVVEPARFEPLDCRLDARGALSIAVPGDFKPRQVIALHLLPGKELWAETPHVGGEAAQRFRLRLSVDGGPPLLLDDFRLQQLITGAAEAELRAQPADLLRAAARSALLAEGLSAEEAEGNLARLLQQPRYWDGPRLRAGSTLRIELLRVAGDGAADEPLPGFPIEHRVGSEAAQLLWISPRSSP